MKCSLYPLNLSLYKELFKIYQKLLEQSRKSIPLNKKEQLFGRVLQSRLDELNINKENFKVLIDGLTELSKSENTDAETKVLYRDMIKTLFDIFTTNLHSSQDISNYLKDI